MEYKEFEKEIIKNGKKIGLDIAEKESKNLYKYMLLMLEWNENVNLTAITEEKEIIYKHFIDSLSVNKYLTNKEKIMEHLNRYNLELVSFKGLDIYDYGSGMII